MKLLLVLGLLLAACVQASSTSDGILSPSEEPTVGFDVPTYDAAVVPLHCFDKRYEQLLPDSSSSEATSSMAPATAPSPSEYALRADSALLSDEKANNQEDAASDSSSSSDGSDDPMRTLHHLAADQFSKLSDMLGDPSFLETSSGLQSLQAMRLHVTDQIGKICRKKVRVHTHVTLKGLPRGFLNKRDPDQNTPEAVALRKRLIKLLSMVGGLEKRIQTHRKNMHKFIREDLMNQQEQLHNQAHTAASETTLMKEQLDDLRAKIQRDAELEASKAAVAEKAKTEALRATVTLKDGAIEGVSTNGKPPEAPKEPPAGESKEPPAEEKPPTPPKEENKPPPQSETSSPAPPPPASSDTAPPAPEQSDAELVQIDEKEKASPADCTTYAGWSLNTKYCKPRGVMWAKHLADKKTDKVFYSGTMIFSHTLNANQHVPGKGGIEPYWRPHLEREFHMVTPGIVTSWTDTPFNPATALATFKKVPSTVYIKAHPVMWSIASAMPKDTWCAHTDVVNICQDVKNQDYPGFRAACKKHIFDVIGLAKDLPNMKWVDVLNEQLSVIKIGPHENVYYKAWGNTHDYVRDFYRWAREAAQAAGRSDLKLCYNDFNIIHPTLLTPPDASTWGKTKFTGLVQFMSDYGKDTNGNPLIDCLGFQAHMHTGWAGGPMFHKDADGKYRSPPFKNAMEAIHKVAPHVKFHVSELSIARKETEVDIQSNMAEALYRTCIEFENCEMITQWGNFDSPVGSSVTGPFDPGNNKGPYTRSQPYDEDGRIKDSYQTAIKNALS